MLPWYRFSASPSVVTFNLMSLMLLALSVLLPARTALVHAQPGFQAPLLTMTNSIPISYHSEGFGYRWSTLTMRPVPICGWTFTASSSDGVYAINLSTVVDYGGDGATTFYDPIVGVTQMWSHCAGDSPLTDQGDAAPSNCSDTSSCSVVVIAGSTIALYRFNETDVWRDASFTDGSNATFDMSGAGATSIAPSVSFPTIATSPQTQRPMYIVGSQKNQVLESTVYALDTETLQPVWSTLINAQSTNFIAALSDDRSFLYVLTQNGTTHMNKRSNAVIQRLSTANGSLSSSGGEGGWSMANTTLTSDAIYMSSGDNVLVALGGDGKLFVAYQNGTQLSDIPTQIANESCYPMPLVPLLVNGVWYIVCGSTLVTLSSSGGEQLEVIVKRLGGIIQRVGMLRPSNDLVPILNTSIYVVKVATSVVQKVFDLPAVLSGAQTTCVGVGRQDLTPSSRDVIHVTFSSIVTDTSLRRTFTYSKVVTINARSGDVLSQTDAHESILGGAVVDVYSQRLVAAAGSYLQVYYLVPQASPSLAVFQYSAHPNTNVTNTLAGDSLLVFNTTSMAQTYVVSKNFLYVVDNKGNSTFLYKLPQTVTMYYSPMIVGSFVVLITYYTMYVWDASLSAMQLLTSLPSLDPYAAPQALYDRWVIVFHMTGAPTIVDLQSVVTSGRLIGYSVSYVTGSRVNGAALMNDTTILVVTSGPMQLKGLDLSTFNPQQVRVTPEWTTDVDSSNSLSSIASPLVAHLSHVYFVVEEPNLKTSTSAYWVTRVSGDGGQATRVGQATGSNWHSKFFLVIKYGGDGVYQNGAVMYIFGPEGISAYTPGWNLLFEYQSHEVTAFVNNWLKPQVLDSGAVCFRGAVFTVINGLTGLLAWDSTLNAPLKTSAITVDRTGQTLYVQADTVAGANVFTGESLSSTTYLSTVANFQGVATDDGVLIVGTTILDDVFAQQAIAPYPPTDGTPTSFAGAYPVNDGDFGSHETSSDWKKYGPIIGGTGGGVVVLAVAVAVLWRRHKAHASYQSEGEAVRLMQV